MKTIRWGVIGPGAIAHKFAKAMHGVHGASLVAVASRSPERAETFACQYGIENAYGTYAELAEAPGVDAIYVCTPHSHHADVAEMCLAHGKSVLCEKPITVNATQLERLIALANHHQQFLMEAMWTRFLPIMEVVRCWLDEGKIGVPQAVQADFGFRGAFDPAGRLFNPALAGGALLDVGVYPVSFAHWVFNGPPSAVKGVAIIGETGVDESMSASLRFGGGGVASLMSAITVATPGMAKIFGSEGKIELGPQFWQATSAVLHVKQEAPLMVERPHRVNGFEYEIMEACECIRAGNIQSHRLSHIHSLEVMRTLDALRAQWGLRYPCE